MAKTPPTLTAEFAEYVLEAANIINDNSIRYAFRELMNWRTSSNLSEFESDYVCIDISIFLSALDKVIDTPEDMQALECFLEELRSETILSVLKRERVNHRCGKPEACKRCMNIDDVFAIIDLLQFKIEGK